VPIAFPINSWGPRRRSSTLLQSFVTIASSSSSRLPPRASISWHTAQSTTRNNPSPGIGALFHRRTAIAHRPLTTDPSNAARTTPHRPIRRVCRPNQNHTPSRRSTLWAVCSPVRRQHDRGLSGSRALLLHRGRIGRSVWGDARNGGDASSTDLADVVWTLQR